MDNLREQFEEKLRQINEVAGGGRSPIGQAGLRKEFEDVLNKINYDLLNKANPSIINPLKEEKYNFNNFYSLDIRLKADAVSNAFKAGRDKFYIPNFTKYYKPEYSKNMVEKLRAEYSAIYRDAQDKASIGGKKFTMVPLHEDPRLWVNLKRARSENAINAIYNQLPVITIYTDENKKDHLCIKNEGGKGEEFVDLIIGALSSAIIGHIPQGVTIEELLQGKFSRKAIAPEQGTFINRVKDPTSDKELDFRAWDEGVLLELHNLIMDTFKRDTSLLRLVPELQKIVPVTRSSIFLYISQENFNALEKGGTGLYKLGKSAFNTVMDIAEEPNF